MTKRLFSALIIVSLLFLSFHPRITIGAETPTTQIRQESTHIDNKAASEEGVYPTGPTCSKLSSAKWDEISLYALTYGCLPAGWESFFNLPDVKAQVNNISNEIASEVKKGEKISPAIGNTFRALYLVRPDKIKAAIMGQDPAPQPGLATGLAFSTEPGVSSSRVASIQRVLLEAQNEGICVNLEDGNLATWAENGVLLLNMALTIPCPVDNEKSCIIGGHIPLWGDFTGQLVSYINTNADSAVFILWGGKAGQYAEKVTNKKHKVIKGGHPSPRVPGSNFFCKNYFDCANKWQTSHDRQPINWNLTDHCAKADPCVWSWHSGTGTSTCQSKCTLSICD